MSNSLRRDLERRHSTDLAIALDAIALPETFQLDCDKLREKVLPFTWPVSSFVFVWKAALLRQLLGM